MKRGERGLAVLEAAAWLTVVLPFALLGATLCLKVYDQRTLAVIPEALLRETAMPSLRWVADGNDGSFGLEAAELRASAAKLVAAAAGEARASLVQTGSVSARACCWVFQVDEATGAASAIERQECVSSGSLELSAELEAALESSAAPRLGVLADGAETGEPRYIHRSLVVGLAVAGLFLPPVPALPRTEIKQAHIAYPRQEFTL